VQSELTEAICKGAYPTPNQATPACQTIIGSMLRVRPDERISLEEIMSHPWARQGSLASLADIASRQVCPPPQPGEHVSDFRPPGHPPKQQNNTTKGLLTLSPN